MWCIVFVAFELDVKMKISCREERDKKNCHDYQYYCSIKICLIFFKHTLK